MAKYATITLSEEPTDPNNLDVAVDYLELDGYTVYTKLEPKGILPRPTKPTR